MNDLHLPEAIFFDWDGTLVDSYGFLNGAHNNVRSQFGMEPLPEGGFARFFGLPREQLFIDIYGNRSEEAKAAFEKYYLANHLHDLEVLDGVEEMLECIAQSGIIMGVVSNKKSRFLQAEVLHLGWDKYFHDIVIGAGDASADKPDGAPILLAAKKAGNLSSSKIWYVGDTHIDVQASLSAGCPCILVAPIEVNNIKGVSVKNYSEICGFLLQCMEKSLKKRN